ncbi:MAG TPA: YoaK family protein [Chitinophaga sp.]|nr:YoaK family protein [Chitinophaga sp.]
MLREVPSQRSLQKNLMLASSTASVAGMTNVVGVIAFLSFVSNVTGHVATLAGNISDRNIREVYIVIYWLFMFFLGAFISNFIVRSLENKSTYRANATPILMEIIILTGVAIYGNDVYNGSEMQREAITGAVLFSMGLQNGLVSRASGGLIKTTHLTGLITDLGVELAELLHPNVENTRTLREKIYIRLTILAFFIFGGVLGGYLFNIIGIATFFVIPCILFTILLYDIYPILLHRLKKRLFS